MVGAKTRKTAVIAGLAGLLSLESCAIKITNNYYDNDLKRPVSVQERYGAEYNPRLFVVGQPFWYNRQQFFFQRYDPRTQVMFFYSNGPHNRRTQHRVRSSFFFQYYSTY